MVEPETLPIQWGGWEWAREGDSALRNHMAIYHASIRDALGDTMHPWRRKIDEWEENYPEWEAREAWECGQLEVELGFWKL